MIERFVLLLGEATLPAADALSSGVQGTTRIQPALIAVAALAVGIVAFLGIDFYRQKRVERKEREKVMRFRQRRLAEAAREAPLHRSA